MGGIEPNITEGSITMKTILVTLITGSLLLAAAPAGADFIPYGHGCVTTVVHLPDGRTQICTTCPTGNGLAVTHCQ